VPFGAGSGDGFAHIDIVSNHTVFREQEHYRALLRGHDLPGHTFSSFIHEATHHWCFISPVGTALSLLYLSVARKALRWMTTEDESDLKSALDDLCAFEIAERWMRPLNEGLAQFAEYDVLPPRSGRLMSPPLHATLTHLFNLPRRLAEAPQHDPTPAFYQLSDDIISWRLSRQTIDRKSELLLQPIGPGSSPYLLGYLTVKQLWKSSARFYEELQQADTFLMFMRKLIYADYSLITELLDRARPGRERGALFAQRLYQRLHAIRMMTFDEDVPWSEWERLLTPPTADDDKHGLDVADGEPFVGLDSEELVRRGLSMQAKLVAEVSEPIDVRLKSPEHRFPSDYFANVLQERHLMWLGNAPGKWTSTGPQKGRVTVEGDVVFDKFTLEHSSDQGLDALTLDIYIDLYAGYQLTTIGNERGVFGFAARHRASHQESPSLMRAKLDRREIVFMTNLIHEVVRGYTVGTNYRDSLDHLWESGGNALLEDTYVGYAFNFDDEARAVVSDQGLADVLENDADLVRGVAAVTLAASAGLSAERAREICPDLELGPAETTRRVKGLWTHDLPLAGVDDEGFLKSAF
jgi:hypothetical protein